MDNLYRSWNQSCQYEKISPNSIVVPVLADGRPGPIPTKCTTDCRLTERMYELNNNLTKMDKLYSLGVVYGAYVDSLRSSPTAYGSRDKQWQRHYYGETVGHFIGIVLCGWRRTGSRVFVPARACVRFIGSGGGTTTTTTSLNINYSIQR
ncbi:Hypothetical protein CINCED_3A016618 [Cinara cedri]|uniref:Uncharacterized protein n=1 Tax=Cinara cedri TaxID=506608 RepID=A0A5E4NAM7_9HEMI|nr:Hypothetical protein CINCED_3A016618 [Cinara cedri]